MNRKVQILIYLLAVMLLASCYETRNLPPDETLYVGITDYDFGVKRSELESHQKAEDEQEGVITSMVEAYNAVDQALQGDFSALKNRSSRKREQAQMTRQQRDSIRREVTLRDESWITTKAEVDGVLAYSPNNSLLGSSRYRFPLPLGLWVYNRYADSHTRFGRWMFNSFAADPKYISTANPQLRVQVARNTLRNYGYFRGQVDFRIVPQRNPRKARIAYDVQQGPLFRLDTISVQQFPAHADSLIRASQPGTLLHQGDAFRAANLSQERTRLSNIFRDHGYYYYQPEHFTFRADTVQRPLYVQLQMRPAPTSDPRALHPYHIGRTTIQLYRYGDYLITDSVQRRSMRFLYGGGQKPPMRLGAIRRWLYFRQGDLYSQTTSNQILEKLASMGTFSQIALNYVPRDTSLTCDTLDLQLALVLDKPYNSEFQGNVTSKTNGLVGPGVSFSMTKKNAFRGAESLSLEAYGSYEWQTGAEIQGKRSTINSYEYGASLNLEYPRIMFMGLTRRLNRHAMVSSSTYKIEADWLNRSGYFGRVSFGGRVVYNYQRRPTIKHEFIPIRLVYEHQLHTTARFDSIAAANQALYVSMRDQFVPSMQYSVRLTSRAGARNPRSLSLTFKEAGNVTSTLYRAFGRPFSEREKHLLGVPFAQYFRATAEFTDQVRIRSTRTYLVGRIMAGAVWSYGNSSIAPYPDLFSIGGANSLRAFAIRSIGPGSFHPGRSQYSYIDEVGDLKLEANLEYRFPLVSNLHGALFVDAGNVWLMHPDESRPGGTFHWNQLGRQLALGTGAGLRYDLDFIVVRFDVGVGLHAPYDTGRSGYYNMVRFRDSLGYHLAIGYPF